MARATADPKSGPGASGRAVQRAGDRPDGPASELTYLWDFDDGGANALGRNASHTYTRPGNYTATVTVTDRGGRVRHRGGRDHGRGSAGQRAAERAGGGESAVRRGAAAGIFSSSATDPDGDQVSTVWDFGDGVKAGGANIAHTYTQAGNYTAKVTVRTPGGLTATESVTITVDHGSGTRASGLTAEPRRVRAWPRARHQPLVGAPKSKGVRTDPQAGLRLRVACDTRRRAARGRCCSVSGERLGASKAVRIGAGKSRTVVVRLDRTVRRNLLAAMRQAGIRRLKATAVTKLASMKACAPSA